MELPSIGWGRGPSRLDADLPARVNRRSSGTGPAWRFRGDLPGPEPRLPSQRRGGAARRGAGHLLRGASSRRNGAREARPTGAFGAQQMVEEPPPTKN